MRDLQTQITTYKSSKSTLEGEIKALTTKKTALETEIKVAEQQITQQTTPLLKAVARPSVDDLLRAAAVINRAKNASAHDSGPSVEDAVLKALDAQARQRRGRSSSLSY